MTTLREAATLFEAYQTSSNSREYARMVCANVRRFVEYCEEVGVHNLKDVSLLHISGYLQRSPQGVTPGAWRDRYTAVPTFLHYIVFIGLIAPEQNPMAESPGGETLTNKRMIDYTDLQRLIMAIPNTHQGMQDTLCVLLLWHGYTLRRINQLEVLDIDQFPAPCRELAQRMVTHRKHAPGVSLLVKQDGTAQMLHGQVLNRRLQKYAKAGGLSNADRVL